MSEIQSYDSCNIADNEGLFITHMNDLFEKALDYYGDEEWDESDEFEDEMGY